MSSSLDQHEGYIRHRVEIDHITHRQLSEELRSRFPGERGFSVRNIECFCRDRGIHKSSRLSEAQVREAVAEAVAKVGPTYGRKTLTGLLAAEGIRIAEERVGKALRVVNPSYQEARRNRAERRLNPIPYQASHFGHKLHVDQNEKLVMYGVTHICAIDGFSAKVVGFISMPVKNNLEIYDHMFRPLLMEYGIWEQVRVDQGKEWMLMLFVQEQLAHFRRDSSKPPHRQTTSKLNHTVERFWPEVNSRVNYPIKACLVAMEERGDFDMDAEAHKYCVSWFTLHVANAGTSLVVKSWNEHRIPGKGVPNQRMRSNNLIRPLTSEQIPTTDEAVQQYNSLGGHLTLCSKFGQDPLEMETSLAMERERRLQANIPHFNIIFNTLVNGNDTQFRQGLKMLIELTEELTTRLPRSS